MTDEELIARLRSGLDNADRGADGVRELGGVVMTMNDAADRLEALVKANRELTLQGLADMGQAQEAYEAQVKAEARAERLEAALDEIANQEANHAFDRCTCTPQEMLNEARAIARAALTQKEPTDG